METNRVKLAKRLATLWIAIWFTFATMQPAHAAWFLAAAGWLGGLLGVSTIVGGIILVGGLFVVNKLTGGALFGGSKRGARQAQKQGVMVNKNSNNDPITLAYGRMRIGGTRVYVETSNGSGDIAGKDKLNMVLAMCEGEMGDIKKLYFNDTVIWDADQEGTVTGDATNGYTLENYRPKTIGEGEDAEEANKYFDKVEAQYFPGNTNQVVSSLISTSIGSDSWGPNHRLRGVAYMALKLTASQEAFGGSVPTVTAEIAGKKIVDVNATTDFNTPVYVTPSAGQNPVDVLYDMLTDKNYGKGLTYIDINTSSFKSAWTHANGLYKIDGYLDSADKLYDNIIEVLDVCNGLLIYTDGKYKLRIKQQNEAAVATIDYDDIIGNITVSKNTKAEQKNKISITWNNPNEETKYNEDLLVVENDTYLSEDNGTTLEENMEILLITDVDLLTRLANYKLNASRNQLSIVFTGSHRLMNIEPGEIVNINNEELGFVNKPFRVLSTSISDENNIEFACGVYVSDIELEIE